MKKTLLLLAAAALAWLGWDLYWMRQEDRQGTPPLDETQDFGTIGGS